MKPITGKEFYSIIGNMPRLRHTPEGASGEEGFDLEKSAVIAWLKDNLPPLDVLGQIFWKLKLAGAIIWDPADRTWRGRNPDDYEKARAAKAEARETRREAKAVALAKKKASVAKKRGRKKQAPDDVLALLLEEWVRENKRLPTLVELCAAAGDTDMMGLLGCLKISVATFYIRLRSAKADTGDKRIEVRSEVRGGDVVKVLWSEGAEKKLSAGPLVDGVQWSTKKAEELATYPASDETERAMPGQAGIDMIGFLHKAFLKDGQIEQVGGGSRRTAAGDKIIHEMLKISVAI